MEILPREIINKMFLFTQHPVAELFKKEFKGCIEDMNDDENFSYQWADMKEQRKYQGCFYSCRHCGDDVNYDEQCCSNCGCN